MASAAGRSLVDSLFQRSLDDLIKSLRSQPVGESALVTRAADDARREIRSTDADTKSVALHKLTYLFSLYHLDASATAFPAVELLASPCFLHKRLAYLAASLIFHPSTDVLLLITNQLRKDLASPTDPVASLALEFLAVGATPDLARDLTPEVHGLLASSRSVVRKKSTAAILRVFSQCPDSVRIAFKRLVENMECADQRIVSAAIGVFCELTSSDPKAYLPLAPEFYQVLVNCRNNWVLIKVLKIFARLAPLEPRLAKRVVDPVCELMGKSAAKSLVLECIRTALSSLDEYEHAVRLAVEKTKEFLASEDPNLKYLGLQAMSMLKPMHSWAVEESRDVIVKSLDDTDFNIKKEALHLLMGLLSESNVTEVCNLLVKHALKADPFFCNEILAAVLSSCSRNFYELIVDFEWYVSLLGDVSCIPHCMKGEEIERQLVDIGLRVKDVRPELVQMARDLLIDPALLGNPLLHRILSAAAWISGEYIEFSRNPVELVEALLQPRVSLLPPLVRAVYIQALLKILLFCHSSYQERIEAAQTSGGHDSASNMQNFEISITSRREIGSDIIIDEIATDDTNYNDITSNFKVDLLWDLPDSKDPFCYGSIDRMLNLSKTALLPLLQSDDVEVQERAGNVISLIQELQETQVNGVGNIKSSDSARNFELMKLMQEAVSEELGPVPLDAQERVAVPEDLDLLDNLNDLVTILGDDKVEQSAASFSFEIRQPGNTREESSSVVESSSSLAEHRKRHGLYYLAVAKDETESADYPRAKECPNEGDAPPDVSDDLLKLTQKAHIDKKTKPLKVRPVVIKLDGEDVSATASLRTSEAKRDPLSGAVNDVLLGYEDIPSSSKGKAPELSSRQMLDDKLSIKDSNSPRKEYSKEPDLDQGNSKSKHKRRHKHRHKSSQGGDEHEEKGHRKSSDGSHTAQKPRKRGDNPTVVLSQVPIAQVQDFLL